MHCRFRNLVFGTLMLFTAQLAFAESPEQESTIGRKLEGIEKASTFTKLLKNTDNAKALLFAPTGTTTVFVPTNDAFAKMDKMQRDKLLDPSNKHWLERVLTYHALHNTGTDGYLVKRVDFLLNGLGQYLTVNKTDEGKITIDGANVSETDLVCSNGIVHFIDDVLIPVELDLFERLEADGRFTTLSKLITRSGLSKLFQNRHDVYTVFAPTDEAFSKLPPGTVDSLMSPEKLDLLSDIIRSHIVSGVQTVGKIENIRPLGTPGTSLVNQFQQSLIYRKDDQLGTVDGRRILEADLVARNGFIHVIDRPLLSKRESLADRLKAEGKFDKFLSLCRQTGVYDLLGQFNEKVTVFAPVDSVFETAEMQEALKSFRGTDGEEQLRGLILRHFVRSSEILTTNAISFRRFNTALRARIDFERDGDSRTIQGIKIESTDLLARNGVAHGIQGLIPAAMEDVDKDQRWETYRKFVMTTLEEGSKLYSQGELKKATDYYARRNYEFVSRYGNDLNRLYDISAAKLLNDDRRRNYRYGFALTAWDQRNGFKNLLRVIEAKQPLLIDELDLLREGMNVIVIGNRAAIDTPESAK